jgi:hypothetical protein
MNLSLNLRGDLAKLSDQELAERLEQAWRAYDQANDYASSRKSKWHIGWLDIWRWRGPFRHPRAYRFFATLDGVSGVAWLDFALALVFSDKRFEELMRAAGGTEREMYLHACEMRDIVDEAERRINEREGRKP